MQEKANALQVITPIHSLPEILPLLSRVDVIPQNLYPKINVILISRIKSICNFIGKYRFNVKDGGN
jgi:proteasome lid subunit RPN8/RPN11